MMKNPPHPGQGLKDEIEALGLSVAQFAKALGVTRQQLYRLINGDCGITPEMAVRLELVVGGSADFWLRLQMNYDLVQIRNRASQFNLKRLARPEVV
jgi:addiction module HigA family antidote